MSKDSRKKATPKTVEGTAKLHGIPPEIGQLIETETRSVRVDPKRYFSKKFRAVLPLIQYRLKESSSNTFTWKSELFEEFISALRLVLEKQKSYDTSSRPSDWTPFVLGFIAEQRGESITVHIDPKRYWELISIHPEGYWEHACRRV